ncbi:MAG: glycosyltransferase family 4 protein [Pseudomonadota bacterium]|nr:glycosyltransferase family 4 protein [Pseudomonadota bacterium]
MSTTDPASVIRGRRILFVHNDIGYFLSHRLPVAKAAVAAGAEVWLAAPDDAKARSRLEAQGIHFCPWALSRRGMNPLGELAAVAALYRIYRQFKPDLVHHVTIKPVLYGSFAARIAGVGAVVNAVPGLGYVFTTAAGWRGGLLRRAVKTAYRLALSSPRVRVIFQNPDDRDTFVSNDLVDQSRAVLIRGSGVDVATFSYAPEPPEPALIVFASRMLWDKGVGEFVAAAQALRQRGINARFALVGEPDTGNPEAVPRSQLQSWHDSGAIEWWGYRNDMPEVLRESHIVCLPSAYGEGVPKILIEAAARGRAIVTTDSPGCREIVQHEVNGLLVPVRDTPALTEALARLIGDSALRSRMGQAGRRLAESEFAVEKVVAASLDVYAELLAG